MGGIKNKLTKQLSKFLPLDRRNASGISSRSTSGQPEVRRSEGGRRSLPDEATKAEGFCFNHSNPQSSCGRQLPLRKGAQDLLWGQRRQMKSARISIGGFDRLVKLTKYTSLACLSLAILSILILNIASSYSSSKVNSNAEPIGNSNANVSALADNEASTNALDPLRLPTAIIPTFHFRYLGKVGLLSVDTPSQ